MRNGHTLELPEEEEEPMEQELVTFYPAGTMGNIIASGKGHNI